MCGANALKPDHTLPQPSRPYTLQPVVPQPQTPNPRPLSPRYLPEEAVREDLACCICGHKSLEDRSSGSPKALALEFHRRPDTVACGPWAKLYEDTPSILQEKSPANTQLRIPTTSPNFTTAEVASMLMSERRGEGALWPLRFQATGESASPRASAHPRPRLILVGKMS